MSPGGGDRTAFGGRRHPAFSFKTTGKHVFGEMSGRLTNWRHGARRKCFRADELEWPRRGQVGEQRQAFAERALFLEGLGRNAGRRASARVKILAWLGRSSSSILTVI
jgi:hypothetical protein